MSATPPFKPLPENQPATAASIKPEVVKKRNNYLLRHWRGELSLAQSFWGNTIGINILVAIINRLLASIPPVISLVGVAAVIFAFWTFALSLAVWQYVGVWRAARAYIAAGDPPGIANIARTAIVIFAIASVVGLYRNVSPQILEAVRIVSGDSQFEDFKVTVLPNGKAIEFYGGIKLGASNRLREVLDSAPYVTVVHLETLGGRIGEALEMARIIKERKLSTYIPRMCASAGVIVFLAGKERTIRNDAQVGFHMSTFAGMGSPEITELSDKILLEAGVSRDFVKRASRSNEFWWPKSDELVKEGIVTSVTHGQGFGLGTAEIGKDTLESIRESMLSRPMYNALAKVKPDEFEAAIVAVHHGVKAGQGYADAAATLNSLLMSTVSSRFTEASDAAMTKWVEFNLKVLENNMDRNPKDTLAKITAAPETQRWTFEDIKKRFPDWPKDFEHELYTVVLSTQQVKLNEEMKAAGTEGLANVFLENFSEKEVDLLTADPQPTDLASLKALCELYVRFYKAVKAHPKCPQIARCL